MTRKELAIIYALKRKAEERNESYKNTHPSHFEVHEKTNSIKYIDKSGRVRYDIDGEFFDSLLAQAFYNDMINDFAYHIVVVENSKNRIPQRCKVAFEYYKTKPEVIEMGALLRNCEPAFDNRKKE